jgi:hypothetical protein
MSLRDGGNERTFELIGTGSAIVQAAAITTVCGFTFGSFTYGAVAGLFTGAGGYLFLPWFLGLQTVQAEGKDSLPFSEVIERAPGSTQRGVLGFGLEQGGILMFVAAFLTEEPNLLVGGGVAVAATLAIYLVGTVLLDR